MILNFVFLGGITGKEFCTLFSKFTILNFYFVKIDLFWNQNKSWKSKKNAEIDLIIFKGFCCELLEIKDSTPVC